MRNGTEHFMYEEGEAWDFQCLFLVASLGRRYLGTGRQDNVIISPLLSFRNVIDRRNIEAITLARKKYNIPYFLFNNEILTSCKNKYTYIYIYMRIYVDTHVNLQFFFF